MKINLFCLQNVYGIFKKCFKKRILTRFLQKINNVKNSEYFFWSSDLIRRLYITCIELYAWYRSEWICLDVYFRHIFKNMVKKCTTFYKKNWRLFFFFRKYREYKNSCHIDHQKTIKRFSSFIFFYHFLFTRKILYKINILHVCVGLIYVEWNVKIREIWENMKRLIKKRFKIL